jgi:hypothetical protein
MDAVSGSIKKLDAEAAQLAIRDAETDHWITVRKKVLLVASIPIILSPLSSSIYIPAYPTVQQDLNGTPEEMVFTIAGNGLA